MRRNGTPSARRAEASRTRVSEQVTEVREQERNGRVKASPLARRIARERGIDLAQPGHRAGGTNRRRGRGARRDRAAEAPGGCARCRSVRRGRGRAADVDPQDDRAPPDRGLAGAGLPDLHVGGHEPGAHAPRAARRAREGRPEADDLGRPHQDRRVGAHAPPAAERRVRRRGGADPPVGTSAWRWRPTAGSSSR